MAEAYALCPHTENLITVKNSLWAPELFATGPRIANPGIHTLPDEITLKLSNRGDNREQRLPERTGRINVLLIADELNSKTAEFFQGQKQVLG